LRRNNVSVGGITKIAMVVSIAVGTVIVLIYGVTYFKAQYSKDTAGVRGQTGEREKVEADADYRIAQKQYFHDQCGAIAAKQENIETLKGAGMDDEAAANEIKLNEMVEDYNAASDNPNKGRYRDSSLPKHIDAGKEVAC
jgi:hypothetical protein